MTSVALSHLCPVVRCSAVLIFSPRPSLLPDSRRLAGRQWRQDCVPEGGGFSPVGETAGLRASGAGGDAAVGIHLGELFFCVCLQHCTPISMCILWRVVTWSIFILHQVKHRYTTYVVLLMSSASRSLVSTFRNSHAVELIFCRKMCFGTRARETLPTMSHVIPRSRFCSTSPTRTSRDGWLSWRSHLRSRRPPCCA